MSQNVFMWLLALCKSLEHVYSNRLLIFLTQYSSFSCSLLRVLFIFWMLYPYQTWFSNISSHPAGCLFTFLIISLDEQRCLILLKSHLPIFLKSIYLALLGLMRETDPLAESDKIPPVVILSQSYVVVDLFNDFHKIKTPTKNISYTFN